MSAAVRLFVAVDPSAEAVAALATALAPVRDRLPEARWIPAERWHLTLVFLGDVEADRVPPVEKALGAALPEIPAASLRMAGAGTFPSRGRPSVLWVGLAGDLPELAALARVVRRAVRSTGVRLQRQAFRPHLTVARFRQAPAGAAAPALAELAAYAGPAFTVPAVRLVRSHLGPAPRHETAASWALARPDP